MSDPALIWHDSRFARLMHHHVSLRYLYRWARLVLLVVTALLHQRSLAMLDLRLVLFNVNIFLLNAVQRPPFRLLDLLHHPCPW